MKNPYAIVKKSQLHSFQEKIADRESTISAAADFVKQIEDGNLEAQLSDSLASDDILVKSLLSMRDQMKKFSTEEAERNWVVQGLAKFVDILRAKDDTAALADSIINNLVKYLGANQGAMYLINDEVKDNPFIELVACYAYDRKKYRQQRIEFGEGLVGQCVLEKATTYLTDVPNDYVRITSGLGEAPPSNVLIVPLKLENKIFGVIELAAFQKIHQYRITFVEKLAESIASTVANVKTNEQTKKLLQETQVQAEQMRAQEEEMRQNMEELSATQEEMHRVLKEVQSKERYLNDLINASADPICTVDLDYKLVSFNDAFVGVLKASGVNPSAGFDMLSLFRHDEGELKKQIDSYQRVFAGEAFERQDKFTFNGANTYHTVTFSPIRNEKGKVVGAAVFSKDITETTKAKLSVDAMLEESKNQQAYFNDVINGIGDCIVTIDRDFNIVLANQAFHRIFGGLGVPTHPGSSLLAMAKSGNLEDFKRPYLEAFEGKPVEVPHRHHFGRDYHTFYNPLKNSEGEVIGVGLLAHDITDLMNTKLLERERADGMINAQKKQTQKIVERFSALEKDYKAKIKELEEKLKNQTK